MRHSTLFPYTTLFRSVGVAQRHATYSMLAAESDSAFHAGLRVQIAWASASIPALQRAKARQPLRLRLHVDASIANHRNESRKAIDAVRVHAVAGCLSEEPRRSEEHT